MAEPTMLHSHSKSDADGLLPQRLLPQHMPTVIVDPQALSAVCPAVARPGSPAHVYHMLRGRDSPVRSALQDCWLQATRYCQKQLATANSSCLHVTLNVTCHFQVELTPIQQHSCNPGPDVLHMTAWHDANPMMPAHWRHTVRTACQSHQGPVQPLQQASESDTHAAWIAL